MEKKLDTMQPPPDLGTQVRQWMGLVIALGGVAYLVNAGMALGRIEEKVSINEERSRRIGVDFVGHVNKADQGFRDIAKLVSDLDARLAKQEGRQEERDQRR